MQISFDDIVIRPVDEGEAEALLSVYRRCEDFLALGPEPHASMEMVLDDLLCSREEGGIYCGIFRGQELTGVVEFIPDGFKGKPGVAYIVLLMIAIEQRGHGLGSRVVRAVEKEILSNNNIKEIRLGSQVNNTGGIAFWKKMGYKIVSEPITQPDTTVCYDFLKTITG